MTNSRRLGAIALTIAISMAILLPFKFYASPSTSDVAVDLSWVAKIKEFGFRQGYVAIEDSYPPVIPVLVFAAA